MYTENLDNFPTIDVPKTIKDKDDSSDTKNVPVCNDDNILNTLVSRSEIEALVFKAKIVLQNPDNFNREFIAKCFLSDQSFSISEMNVETAGKLCIVLHVSYATPNVYIELLIFSFFFLGALGCRFFSKRKIPNETPNEINVIFKLYVGAKLIIDGFQFVFVDVEDRTLRFMMDHPKEVSWPYIVRIRKYKYSIFYTDI